MIQAGSNERYLAMNREVRIGWKTLRGLVSVANRENSGAISLFLTFTLLEIVRRKTSYIAKESASK